MIAKATAEPIGKREAAAAPAAASATAKEQAEAENQFRTGNVEGALSLLHEAVKKDPDLPPAQVLMSRLYMMANFPAGVRRSLEHAVVEEPADPNAYVLLGEIAVGEGRITEAELLFQKAESLMAKFDKNAKLKNDLEMRICSGLASVGEARENWAEVKDQLEALSENRSQQRLTMRRLARCLVEQKQVPEALEDLKKAAKIEPAMVAPEAIVAQLCEQADDHENAKKYMELALTEAPKDLQTRLIAARWAFDTGQLDEALAQANAALKLDEKSLDAKLLRGMIAVFQKDYRTAERYFEEAHLQAPENFQASNDFALALAEQKDDVKRRRARQYAEDNLRKYPKVAQALSTYGWVAYKMNQLDEAEGCSGRRFRVRERCPKPPTTSPRSTSPANDIPRPSCCSRGRMKEPGPFAMRAEAKALLEQIEKAPGDNAPAEKAPAEKAPAQEHRSTKNKDHGRRSVVTMILIFELRLAASRPPGRAITIPLAKAGGVWSRFRSTAGDPFEARYAHCTEPRGGRSPAGRTV